MLLLFLLQLSSLTSIIRLSFPIPYRLAGLLISLHTTKLLAFKLVYLPETLLRSSGHSSFIVMTGKHVSLMPVAITSGHLLSNKVY